MMQKIMLAAGAIFLIGLSSNLMGETSLLINIKSGMLVFGGTIVIGFFSFPMKNYRDLFKTLLMPLNFNEADSVGLAKQIAKLSRVNRLYGNLALEKEIHKTDNRFLRKGIELVVDGYDSFDIHNIMEKEYELHFSRRESVVNMLGTFQKLAPVIGFVGTIIGLIDVLGNMGATTEMGRGMAVALHTTLYGLLFANFLFLPLHKKLSEHIKTEVMLLNIILEGVLDIAKEKNSKAIAHRLQSYLDNYYDSNEREVNANGRKGLQFPFNPLQKIITKRLNA